MFEIKNILWLKVKYLSQNEQKSFAFATVPVAISSPALSSNDIIVVVFIVIGCVAD